MQLLLPTGLSALYGHLKLLLLLLLPYQQLLLQFLLQLLLQLSQQLVLPRYNASITCKPLQRKQKWRRSIP